MISKELYAFGDNNIDHVSPKKAIRNVNSKSMPYYNSYLQQYLGKYFKVTIDNFLMVWKGLKKILRRLFF
jgi:hypothetical protein